MHVCVGVDVYIEKYKMFVSRLVDATGTYFRHNKGASLDSNIKLHMLAILFCILHSYTDKSFRLTVFNIRLIRVTLI